MAEPRYSSRRVYEHAGNTYVIRDVLHASGKPSGQCQYAVQDGDRVTWHPCAEGVMFADIQPLVIING